MLEDVKRQRKFETRTLELKETFWYDVNRSEHANQPIRNLKLEYEVVDEVCGFLNMFSCIYICRYYVNLFTIHVGYLLKSRPANSLFVFLT